MLKSAFINNEKRIKKGKEKKRKENRTYQSKQLKLFESKGRNTKIFYLYSFLINFDSFYIMK